LIRTSPLRGSKNITTLNSSKVIITAAAPEVPQKLIDQMKTGGMMVIPFGSGDVQVMKRLIKQADGTVKEEMYDNFSFVPMLQGKKD